MGISASSQVKSTLTTSSEFNSACDSAFAHCLSLTQQAFPGVFPYQLPAASDHLHSTLTTTPHQLPLILRWVPQPPTRSQIDSALRFVLKDKKKKSDSAKEDEEEEVMMLGGAQFKEWALVLYAEAVAGNAGKALLARVPIGVAGIVGVGAATRSGKGLVGAAIGVYALGVATSIYLGLSG